jgi:hypothetical protein
MTTGVQLVNWWMLGGGLSASARMGTVKAVKDIVGFVQR